MSNHERELSAEPEDITRLFVERARAANTGISAVIDPSGRIVARLGLGIEGVLDASLPAAISPTIYARLGDIPAAITIAAALLFVIRRRFVKRTA